MIKLMYTGKAVRVSQDSYPVVSNSRRELHADGYIVVRYDYYYDYAIMYNWDVDNYVAVDNNSQEERKKQ